MTRREINKIARQNGLSTYEELERKLNKKSSFKIEPFSAPDMFKKILNEITEGK